MSDQEPAQKLVLDLAQGPCRDSNAAMNRQQFFKEQTLTEKTKRVARQ